MAGEVGAWDPRVPLSPLRPDDPAQFGDYRVIGRLGSGGLGDAFLAQDGGRWVVIKAVRPGVADTDALRARLGREINAISLITSPFVAGVLATDLSASRPWFAMEFVAGITLERAVAEDGPLRPADLSRFARSLAEAIAAVHLAGVIHRDLKPANVMLSPEGPRLIDFGIADVTGSTRLTQDGASLGTLFWMSPEQVIGEHATPATDIHAWALVTFYAATGQAPFHGENSVSAMYQVLNVTPTLPPGFPPGLTDAVNRALAKDPRRRPTASELLALLPDPGADPGAAAQPGQSRYWATPQPGSGPAAYQYWGQQAPQPAGAGSPAVGYPGAAVPGAAYPSQGYPAQGYYQQAAPPAAPVPVNSGGSKGHRTRTIALSALVGVLVLAGVGGVVLSNSGDSPSPEPSPTSSSASPTPSRAAWEQATADLASYKEGRTGAWSKPVHGSGDWAAIAVEGKKDAIKLHSFLATPGATAFWMERDETGTGWGGFSDFTFQYVDATGQGKQDILVRAKKGDGSWTGVVVLDDATFASFIEDGKEYVGYYDLDYADGRLVVPSEPKKKFKFTPDTGSFQVSTD